MSDAESTEYVMQTAREHDVKFIRLWFTDILGSLKSMARGNPGGAPSVRVAGPSPALWSWSV